MRRSRSEIQFLFKLVRCFIRSFRKHFVYNFYRLLIQLNSIEIFRPNNGNNNLNHIANNRASALSMKKPNIIRNCYKSTACFNSNMFITSFDITHTSTPHALIALIVPIHRNFHHVRINHTVLLKSSRKKTLCCQYNTTIIVRRGKNRLSVVRRHISCTAINIIFV